MDIQMLLAMHEAQSVDGVPTKEDDGKFIPEHLLLEWHCKMQKKRPQVYPPDERLFGSSKGQYPYGTVLQAAFSIDPKRPVHCQVRGSKWSYNCEVMQLDDDKEPNYVLSIYGYLHLVDMRSAHREEEWTVVSIPSVAASASAATTTNNNIVAANDDDKIYSSEMEGGSNMNTGCTTKPSTPKEVKGSNVDEKILLDPNDPQQAQKIQDYVLKIPRECIECDAEECKTRNPTYRCSRCQSVYYCSKNCQRKHWKEHKHDCVPTEEMRDSFAYWDEVMPENKIPKLEQGAVECGICLQDPSLANPVILPACQHVFCFLCIEKWKIHQNAMNLEQIACCPFCRAEIPEDMEVEGLDDQLCDRVFELATRAERRNQGSDEQKAMCEEGLSIVNQLIERDPENVSFLHAKAKVLEVKGGHTVEVLTIVSKILDIDKQKKEKLMKVKEAIASEFDSKIGDESAFPCLRELALKDRMEEMENKKGILPSKTHISLVLASALIQDKNWEAALEIYQDLYQITSNRHTCIAIKCPIMIGMCRCFYEMGRYHDSIVIGMEAIFKVHRSYPGAHKYVALSMKASTGGLDSAIDFMNQAVLYEAPWDDKNKLEALNLYNELRALKANSLKSEKREKSEKGEKSERSTKNKKSLQSEKGAKSEKSKGVVKESIIDQLFRQIKLVEDIESGNYPEIYQDDDDEYDEDYDDDNPYYFHYNTADM